MSSIYQMVNYSYSFSVAYKWLYTTVPQHCAVCGTNYALSCNESTLLSVVQALEESSHKQ